jgi:hypothetical protein
MYFIELDVNWLFQPHQVHSFSQNESMSFSFLLFHWLPFCTNPVLAKVLFMRS